MDNTDILQDLRRIRSLMEKSNKFISISGLSGILAGIYTLLAAAYVHWRLGLDMWIFPERAAAEASHVLAVALVLLVMSVATGVFMALQKAAKAGESAWNPASRLLLGAVAAPLLTGGIMAVLAWQKSQYEVIAPCLLVFYGLALYAGSRFSFPELRVLGIVQMVLGILAYGMSSYGLLFFAIGFGIMHVLYGAVILKKYGA